MQGIHLKNIYISKGDCELGESPQSAAVQTVVLSKAFAALVAASAVSISEDATGLESSGAEKGPVLQYHCCALKILHTKASVVTGVQSGCTHTHTLLCFISTQTDPIKEK